MDDKCENKLVRDLRQLDREFLPSAIVHVYDGIHLHIFCVMSISIILMYDGASSQYIVVFIYMLWHHFVGVQ